MQSGSKVCFVLLKCSQYQNKIWWTIRPTEEYFEQLYDLVAFGQHNPFHFAAIDPNDTITLNLEATTKVTFIVFFFCLLAYSLALSHRSNELIFCTAFRFLLLKPSESPFCSTMSKTVFGCSTAPRALQPSASLLTSHGFILAGPSLKLKLLFGGRRVAGLS